MSSGNFEHPDIPHRLGDRFVVQDRIGSGATALTYRGWDERLERPVAIKILRHDFSNDETYVQRFRQEARSAASVSNGNVVDVYDFGQQDGALYIVMQLVDGTDLKEMIQQDAPLPFDRVRRITGQVLDGLQAIHQAGIVHRDIKPQNVLIGKDGQARVTDFGVAHLERDSGLTTVGTTVGTAAYMAPEQAQGGRISEACDIYAVGVMLYEMLTGFLPFNGPTPMATMLEHIQSAPMPPSRRLPGHGITPELDAVVVQALEKDPARRFRSARAMKQALIQAFRAPAERPGDGPTTVAAPAMTARYAAPDATHTDYAPWRQVPPSSSPYRPATSDPMEPYRISPDEGGGLNGAVRALLALLLVAALGLGSWLAYDQLSQKGNSPQPTSTTVPAPTSTTEPTSEEPTMVPTNANQEIETIEPTATEQIIEPPVTPTPESTQAPEPMHTPVPTHTPVSPPTRVVPTETPIPEIPIIEPLDPTKPA